MNNRNQNNTKRYFHTFKLNGQKYTIFTSIIPNNINLRNLNNLNNALKKGVKFAVNNGNKKRTLDPSSRFMRSMSNNRKLMKAALQNHFGLRQERAYRR
jgi:hypothetical protein